MGCCASNLKLKPTQTALDTSSYSSCKRSRSGSRSSRSTQNTQNESLCESEHNSKNNLNASNSSGLGSACSTPSKPSSRSDSHSESHSSSSNNSHNHSRSRSIWSRSQTRPICDDFAEQRELERSCGYYTCSSSAASTPSKRELRRTQDMDVSGSDSLSPAVGNLEWEMFMMQHAQRIMPKTSSPISQRRAERSPVSRSLELTSRSYHKWRHYLQSTPVHLLHNVSHIPEAIAGHFCPTEFPAFSDLEEMESAAKRFKVDRGEEAQQQQQQQQQQQREKPTGYPFQLHLTHTISTDL
ncbi:hypothetical protein KR222_007374 [Zaprionus bogoriensis]|nr:hypothetical protein KR222_007374 [Zaprionus bogoriensis]